jgi:3-deoxy-D-manno-octulosonic-acid transferase
MLEQGGLVSIGDYKALETTLDKFITDKDFRNHCGQKNKTYIENNKGATVKILESLELLLKD